MLQEFYPDHEADDAYGIAYESLYEAGYRGIIFDIDNTLVPHGAPADQRARELFRRLRQIGFQTVLLSNNKEPRVKPFGDAVGSPYVYKAGKPGREGYRKAMELMGSHTGNTLFVGDQLFTDVWGARRAGIVTYLGDQLFTDVWGARRAGIVTYLVKPIHPKEEVQIVLKRRLEWIVLFFYHRSLGRKGK